MDGRNSFVSIPRGLRDIMPTEAEGRRLIENKLRKVFESWGYREIITPTFEFFDNLSSEAGRIIEEEMFKFFDRDGSLLALRPEMTIPIARVVSQRMQNSRFSRLYYSANVFREEPAQRGQQREFYQVGLEFIGGKGAYADAEVIGVLIESLQAVGLKDFQVGIGQVDFFKGVLEGTGMSSKSIKDIQSLLVEKDMVELEQIISQSSISSKDKSKIIEILSLCGGEDIIEKVKPYANNARSKGALENLSNLYEFLKSYSLEEFITFDFGIVRNFEYYTGVVFEVYVPNLGFPLGAGGRYDKLISEFGIDKPACGFALGLERLHICLNEQGVLKKQEGRRVLVFSTQDLNKMFLAAKTLRDKGFQVESVLELSSFEDCCSLAQEAVRWVINADNAPKSVEIFDFQTNLKKVSSLSAIEGEMV
ncbi:ATP phosphoribosyltransferase regulatory subunit [Candidatus Oleimmundimicrobium sp.]|uniref:ATP phosphoribosyltransferase regulatory subunit n=1 Tax=Candidatus Oleimmundimicrobium sp. TaxID=3060597 RepID=UPI002723DB80|nr:ATP phosphoribosyltransferase regulatory subunit [Candidatus Oleimmundimicrobium sp.]MDO8886630.1 ATP phosphoribosyltransferase regulatory subunit [Candidatus Oleimmundimicrobium sp.]